MEKVDENGNFISALTSLSETGDNGDEVKGGRIFKGYLTFLERSPGRVFLRVSALFDSTPSKVYSQVVPLEVGGPAVGITIESPLGGSTTTISPITVQGKVADASAAVTINGVSAPVSNSIFVASIPLNEGPNTISAVAKSTNGSTISTSTLVSLDTTRPHVALYTPRDKTITTDDSITVAGLINDIVVGTVNSSEASVVVNNIPAIVSNRTFSAANVPLALGENIIQAVGTDQAGNQTTQSVTVIREAIKGLTLKMVSGNSQLANIGNDLAEPLVVEVVNERNEPVGDTSVVFRVTHQDGLVRSTSEAAPGIGSTAVVSDANGRAAVTCTVGTRAGSGNNLIEASVVGATAPVVFSASALSSSPKLIVVDSGNNQTGAVGSPLPFPFIATVVDSGNNRLPSVPVTFTVTRGSGSFGGATQLNAVTDSDGRVMATLTLGNEEGAGGNVVEGRFSGSKEGGVTFTASGLIPGPAEATSVSGVVLDNSNVPIEGVTMRLFNIVQGNFGNIPQQVGSPVQTNEHGQFLIKPAPVGVFKLMADGGTARRVGEWPTIEFDMITVSGRDNTVGLPIYLPQLNTQNRLCVGPTTGGTLTLPNLPGFSLTLAPGSATFPGGSRTGCVSVTPVNIDKVPMVPGFGQQPRLVLTIQPVGAHFNPPAAMTLPNVDQLKAREVTEMYSYDHDMASFVAIGTGTVSEDGSVVVSDPGVGVLKAGWHGAGGPNDTGNAGTCAECERCIGSECVSLLPKGDACFECRDDQVHELIKTIEGPELICPAESYNYYVDPEYDSRPLVWGGNADSNGRLFAKGFLRDGDSLSVNARRGQCSKWKLITVSDGAPGKLFETAVCASRPIDCINMYQIGKEAERWAEKFEVELGGGIFGGCADAARHAYLSALASQMLGPVSAKEFLDAHEFSNDNGCTDNNMDLMNNAKGPAIGEEALANQECIGLNRVCIQEAVAKSLAAGQLNVWSGNAVGQGRIVRSNDCRVTFTPYAGGT
jgi:Glucodextranase, domain B